MPKEVFTPDDTSRRRKQDWYDKRKKQKSIKGKSVKAGKDWTGEDDDDAPKAKTDPSGPQPKARGDKNESEPAESKKVPGPDETPVDTPDVPDDDSDLTGGIGMVLKGVSGITKNKTGRAAGSNTGSVATDLMDLLEVLSGKRAKRKKKGK